MKKISKFVSALVVSAALTLGAATAAFADIVYESETITISGSGEYTATDLFDNFKNVMPGDELTQTITLKNVDAGQAMVYLRAVVYDEEGNPLTYSEPFEEADGKDQLTDPENGIGGEGQRDETVATMQDFLAQLHMTVAVGDKVVFDAAPCSVEGLAENVQIGTLAVGESLELDVDLYVPIEMTSDYMDRVGEVHWVFVVEDYGDLNEDPGGGEHDDLEDDIDKDDPLPGGGDGAEDGPLSQTGDYLPVMSIAVVAILAAILALVASRRKGCR